MTNEMCFRPARPIHLLLACALALTTSRAQGQGRTTRDPGRIEIDPAQQIVRVAAIAKSYSVRLTPSFGWTDASQSYSGQFKYLNENLVPKSTLILSGLAASLHSSGSSRMRAQFDAEYDFTLNRYVTLVGSGEWRHTAEVGDEMTFMPEIDVSVGKLTVSPVAFIGSSKATGATSSISSTSYGVFAVYAGKDWKFVPEYDLDAGDATEDSFSMKALWHFEGQRFSPWLFASGAKHNAFSVGTILTLK